MFNDYLFLHLKQQSHPKRILPKDILGTHTGYFKILSYSLNYSVNLSSSIKTVILDLADILWINYTWTVCLSYHKP